MVHDSLGGKCPKSSLSVKGHESSPGDVKIATISDYSQPDLHWGWHLLGFFFSGIQKILPKNNSSKKSRIFEKAVRYFY